MQFVAFLQDIQKAFRYWSLADINMDTLRFRLGLNYSTRLRYDGIHPSANVENLYSAVRRHLFMDSISFNTISPMT